MSSIGPTTLDAIIPQSAGPTTMSAIASLVRPRRRSSRSSRSTARRVAAVNTGRKDAKGRIVWQGPRGGLFVRGKHGKKLQPAMGRA